MLIHRFFLLGLLCVTLPVYGQSQSWTTSNGVINVSNWPETAENQRSIDSLRVHAAVLPSIDTLSIGYGYRVTPGQPYLTFALEWKPGPYAILEGEKTKWDDLKGDVVIESILLNVDVHSEGEPVSSLDFAVDSLMLASYPDLFSEEVTTLTWDTVFPDLPDSTARTLLKKGFSLENPKISRISFVYYDEEGKVAQRSSPQIMPRRPSKRTVYRPGVTIDVRVPIIISRRPTPRPRQAEEPRTVEPRGERVGRGDTTDDDRRTTSDDRRQTERTSDANEDDAGEDGDILNPSGKKKKKEDDEEDEDDLLPAAIAGVAAVALVAVAGGTVGYYGNTKYAPIGLMAGYVKPEGGALLQAGVNSAVIERSEAEQEHFVGKITGFYNIFDSPIQPSIGVGVVVSEDNGNYEYDILGSLGLVGNFGSMIVIGGYDFISGGADIGIAVNLKSKK